MHTLHVAHSLTGGTTITSVIWSHKIWYIAPLVITLYIIMSSITTPIFLEESILHLHYKDHGGQALKMHHSSNIYVTAYISADHVHSDNSNCLFCWWVVWWKLVHICFEVIRNSWGTWTEWYSIEGFVYAAAVQWAKGLSSFVMRWCMWITETRESSVWKQQDVLGEF